MGDFGADKEFTDILKMKVTEIIFYCVNQIQPSQGMVKQQKFGFHKGRVNFSYLTVCSLLKKVSIPCR
jgi:hypothetical protein